jgi:hypothetical protein
LQQGTEVEMNLCHEYKALCLEQFQHNTSLSTTFNILKHGGGCIMLWVFSGRFCQGIRVSVFFQIQISGTELSTGKILEENLVQAAFQQTLGDKFTF